MQRYICIHGHFYQPPRENPWLEAVELQDSAYPYHDWNERITAECYAPNATSRILDDEGRIVQIVNNYAKISFNFGPTLLSWMEEKVPDVYQAILAADQESQKLFSGHGSAMAQVYNHIIMPLANRRDKHTQVLWGIRDFEHRFGRKPEGMWLAETAVDLETLDIMAEMGIRFIVLSPYQARRVRSLDSDDWKDVTGGHIDPTSVYLQRLPSGRGLAVFFYDGPISRAVAFEKLLTKGETFAHRLLSAFTSDRSHPQLVHIATDGESYGHHHPHGDMALAYALHHIETHDLAKLTNYGEYLEKHPPTQEVEIIESTAWSCMHGIERWRSNCGCNSGRPGWHQEWRGPLREALDWLRDTVAPCFEKHAKELLRDPWGARNDYIQVILDRSPDSIQRFLQRHALRDLNDAEISRALKLLELQRHAQLMYTSCGWFFDEISGIETVQIIAYSGRVLQLAHDLFGDDLEPRYLEFLERAKSNIPEHRDGRHIYEKWVKPALVDWVAVGAHYAVSALFESFPEQSTVYCYEVEREQGNTFEAGKAKLLVGRSRITSRITWETTTVVYGVLHFGDHNVTCGVRAGEANGAYPTLVKELSQAFNRAEFPEIVRLFDKHFGGSMYSLKSLFRDEQRKLTRLVLHSTLTEAEQTYRRLYESLLPAMRFVKDLSIPLPRAFQTAATFVINTDLRWALEDDEPDVGHIRKLFTDAQTWNVDLDTPGLAYRFKKTISRLSQRFRSQPSNMAILESLSNMVELARALPFEVDLWQAQNAYYSLLQVVYAEYQGQALLGQENIQLWVDRFIALGNQLGVQVGDFQQKVTNVSQSPTLSQLVEQLMRQPRIPLATYRWQFNQGFTFRDALPLVAYLRELGISDVYASPILKARAGSPHGYDICDPSCLNPELGGAEAFDAFTDALRQHQLGLVLDTVPNHMGVGDPSNLWWQDVLENGPSSVYANYFDIDWHPANPRLDNKVLLPVLEDQYGAVLESGKMQLAYEDGGFVVHYYSFRLPLAPRTYIPILEQPLPKLEETLGADHEYVQELHSIITALGYLPPRTELPPEKVIERNREKEVIKRRIANLLSSSPEVRAAIQATVQFFNGSVGDPSSFDPLDKLLEDQVYRPAFWRVATDEINYRRFFDINELAAIRVERPEVFQDTHQLFLGLLAEGKAIGLRIDHPDGLRDPTRYFRQLQDEYLRRRVRVLLGPDRGLPNLDEEIARLMEDVLARHAPQPCWPLYVVAEKILGENEPLPPEWAVFGTTGYDFLNAVNGLFVNQANRDAFDTIFSNFIGRRMDFNELMNICQKIIMLVSMASEINSLSHALDRISEGNRRYRDFTLNSLTFAIREIIAALVIYRTYITDANNVSSRDRRFVEEAVKEAKSRNPRTAEAIFDFIRDTLLLRNLHDFQEEDRPQIIAWVLKFQQVTGPVLAKGLEDTAFYVYNRLVSLNEVGGHPESFGISLADFHRQNSDRSRHWPHAMLSSSTHDTKRSEDMRARLNALSEIPDDWQAALNRWSQLNAAKKARVEGIAVPVPDRNTEYLLYQTLIGVWPPEPLTATSFPTFRERIANYMSKATHEAKVHTSWINPNHDYDKAVQDFVFRILPDNFQEDPFIKDLLQLQGRLTHVGFWNSLAQLLLKLTCPGVPDFYQGTELWDYSLVDPDNRRPVDYQRRQDVLHDLKSRIASAGSDLTPLTKDLLAHVSDGRIKMYVLYQSLTFRQAQRRLFIEGSYSPLEAVGSKAEHVCAFERSVAEASVIVVVPRLLMQLTGGSQPPMGAELWGDTYLPLPRVAASATYRHLFTGATVPAAPRNGGASLELGTVLNQFPVALLEKKS
ncbi:MAG: malto-oligosyltrehalose synthase [Gemmataceae bacterium]